MGKKTIRSLALLSEQGFLNNPDLPALNQVVNNFSLAISPELLELIDKNNPNDPIAKQFIPSVEELNITPNELIDPIGDKKHTTIKGIIHRYPDRCLFTPVHICPVYCRFCFRKETVGSSSETLTPEEINSAINYISQQSKIWEVILTGGDPLILKPSILETYLKRLSAIEHVEVLRIHTRIPVVNPERINTDMLNALKCNKPVYVVIHANHAQEFSQNAKNACSSLADTGVPLLGQTTLLKNINDNIDALSELMRCFIKNRIKPYYLHHGDLVRGTSHFRTSIESGQQLMRQLRGRFSGICQPTYVLDIPGGHGKVPIGPNYCHPDNKIEDFNGEIHTHFFTERS